LFSDKETRGKNRCSGVAVKKWENKELTLRAYVVPDERAVTTQDIDERYNKKYSSWDSVINRRCCNRVSSPVWL
jgi:hypothetical protein